jgi:antitoxin component YwqK of YwqJK toxin-antitoxin module
MTTSYNKILLTIVVSIICSTWVLGQDNDTINKTDQKGNKQGFWKKINAEGRLQYEGQFINNIPTGTFTYYDSLGNVKAITKFSDNGKVANTQLFQKGIKLSEGEYLNERKNGLWNYYNENSVLVAQESYVNGVPDGTWKIYYYEGSLLEEVPYVMGIKEGEWKQYFMDGAVKTKATYKNGKLEGLATFFHPNGRVFISGPYINNLKNGTWMHFSDKGVTEKREEWVNGYLKKEEYFDKSIERMVKEEK